MTGRSTPTRPRRTEVAPSAAARTVRMGTSTARWVIGATVLGSGIAFLDGTVVNVALPALGGGSAPSTPGGPPPPWGCQSGTRPRPAGGPGHATWPSPAP